MDADTAVLLGEHPEETIAVTQPMQEPSFQRRFRAASDWLQAWPWQTHAADRRHAFEVCLDWSRRQINAGLDPRICDQSSLIECLLTAFREVHGEQPAEHITIIFVAVFNYWLRTTDAVEEILAGTAA